MRLVGRARTRSRGSGAGGRGVRRVSERERTESLCRANERISAEIVRLASNELLVMWQRFDIARFD